MATATRKTATATATAAAATPTKADDKMAILAGLDKAELTAIIDTAETFGGIAKAEWAVALAVRNLKSMGLHTRAKVADFCTWFESATDALGCKISRSRVDRYNQAAAALDHCECNSDRMAEAKALSIDTLGKIARAVKTEKNPEARASAARSKVANYTKARAEGKSATDAEIAVGIAKPKGATETGLDYDGKVNTLADKALAYGEGSYAEALRILRSAVSALETKQKTAAKVAAGKGS